LLAREEPSLLENSKNVMLVLLHLGRNAVPSLAQTGSISSIAGNRPDCADV